LKDIKIYIENPESWFAEKERASLDG